MFFLLLQIAWRPFETRIGDERLSNILWFAGIILATLLLKKPLASFIARIGCNISNRVGGKLYADKFVQLVKKPLELLIQTLLFFVAVNQLTVLLGKTLMNNREGYSLLNIRIGDIVNLVFMFLLILFTTLTISRVFDFLFYVKLEKAYAEDEKEKQQLFPLLKEVAKIVIWSLGVFWVLGSVFHVNIPALITGLGIGGVAIALAAKESVENFFAAFTILTDKPFQTGDTVKLGNLEGKVERIGFRSTRLRNGDGSLYIIPNKKLIGENLENLSQRDTRRVKTVLNLKYGLPEERLNQLIAELKGMIRKSLHIKEPVDVVLESFGENVFQLAISYHLPEPVPNGASVGTVKQEIAVKTYAIALRYMNPEEAAIPVEKKEEAPEEEEKSDSEDNPLGL
ncbi:MAG: mechanosensitive ion channel family protein [Sphingobacteriales bacterium]|nr:MAG: mechanosensitive ion channel family protein [Sphingobacteriales bacterium]